MNALSSAFEPWEPHVAVRQSPDPLDVTVVLLEDGLSSTAIMPIEIFHCAGALWNSLNGTPAEPAFRVTTASLSGDAVRSSYGPDLKPSMSIDDVGRADIVIVPTSALHASDAELDHGSLTPWLRARYAAGAHVAGACMGAGYLAEAGLLDGRRGTTHWAAADQFQTRYPKVNWQPDHIITEDARTLCSGGVCAAIDVSLYLVKKFCGHDVAAQCAKALMLPLPSALQPGYAMLPLSPPHGDNEIRATEVFIQTHYMRDISTADLARAARLGIRTFTRRFKRATGHYPLAYQQAVRIEAAKAMFERSPVTVQEASSAVGYEDAPFFRQLFKRATGMTPAEYRAYFGRWNVRRAP